MVVLIVKVLFFYQVSVLQKSISFKIDHTVAHPYTDTRSMSCKPEGIWSQSSNTCLFFFQIYGWGRNKPKK